MMLQVPVAWQTMIQEVQFEYQIHKFGDFSQLTVITRKMVEELVCKGSKVIHQECVSACV